MWAVLPVKNLTDVKQRLAGALNPEERAGLFRCMVEDVLDAVLGVETLDGVLVVTRDPEVRDLVEGRGAFVLEEPANEGHTTAVARAAHRLCAEGQEGLMQIPGDIPMVTSAELSAVLAAHGGSRGEAQAFTITPSHDRRGSNCVILTPPDLIDLKFGDDSFEPHLASARAAGVEPRIVEQPGIALDIDFPEDLARLAAIEADTRTHRFLARSGIGARLGPGAGPAGDSG